MTLSNVIVKENNLHRIKFVTRANVEKRRERVVDELKEIERRMGQHKQAAIDQGIDISKLLTVIPAFVRKGQHKLVADFEHKKVLLQLDANDYRTIQSFYNLNPPGDQIASAKKIWQATIDKQQQEGHVAILKQRIYTKRLPASFNLLDHSIDGTEKMLAQSASNDDKRATLSNRREKTIAQFKYDLMVIQITTAEELVRSQSNIIAHEKKKLVDSVHGQIPLPKSLVTILKAISNRQKNIIKRMQLINKKKLSFFDNAPVVIEEVAGTIGAIS